MWVPSSISWWARATSSSGIVVSATVRIRPAATSGHTFSTTPQQIAAFSCVGRARSVVAVIEPRLRSRALMSSSPLVPPCMPMITSRPPGASAATLRPRYFAAMLSSTTSAPPASSSTSTKSSSR